MNQPRANVASFVSSSFKVSSEPDTGELPHTAAKNHRQQSKIAFRDGVAPNAASTVSPLTLRTLLPRPKISHTTRPRRCSLFRRRASNSVLRVGSLARRVDSPTRNGPRRVRFILRRNPRPLWPRRR